MDFIGFICYIDHRRTNALPSKRNPCFTRPMPPLSEHLFWDVDRSSIDLERHVRWLVKRVLEYGRWRDWQTIVAHYGKPRLADIVTGLRGLNPRALAFCQAWFNLPPSAFRCSISNPFPLPSTDC